MANDHGYPGRSIRSWIATDEGHHFIVLRSETDAPGQDDQNPTVFWEHSLAGAFVAKRIGVRDPEQMYLAGLLHDPGFIVNLQIVPERFGEAVRKAREEQRSIEDVENELLGFNHCESGLLLAERWELALLIRAAIQHHHRPTQGSEPFQ